jgi:hypothetical protein
MGIALFSHGQIPLRKDLAFPLSTGESGDSDDLFLNFTTFENLRL